jgi:CHAT domain-containing protein
MRGEGVLGMTRGFMYAGASRVMVTLWSISEGASSELMKRVYQGMLGEKHLRPAAALRAAQISMWEEKRWPAPYYWAGFVLEGMP